jgi:DNA-binding XRE family transcriptional regulator
MKDNIKSRNGSKYTTERGKKLIELIASGLTLSEAAKQVGISRRTIYRWKAKYKRFSPKFQQAHRVARIKARYARMQRNREVKFYRSVLKLNPTETQLQMLLSTLKHLPPSIAHSSNAHTKH